jgi:hypothetical protein
MIVLPILNMNPVKRLSLIVMLVFLASCGAPGGGTNSDPGGVVTGILSINWVAPIQREDGTLLILSEIDTYNVYYGNKPGDYQNQIDTSEVTSDSVYIPDFPAGKYYFAVTTVTTDGLEGGYSEEVIVDI